MKRVFLGALMSTMTGMTEVHAERVYGALDPRAGLHETISERVVMPGQAVSGRVRLDAGEFAGCAGGEGLFFGASPRLLKDRAWADDVWLSCWLDTANDEWILDYYLRVPERAAGEKGLYLVGVDGGVWPVIEGARFYIQPSANSDAEARSRTPSGNLIGDPGFEYGPGSTAWYESSTNFSTPICSIADCGGLLGDGAYSGEYWAWFGGAKVEETGVVSQEIVMPVADYLDLDFYLQIPDASERGYFKVFVDNQELFQVTEADVSSFPDFRRVLLGLGDYADGATHELRFEGYVEGAATVRTSFFLDELALVAKTSQDICQADAVMISDVVIGSGMNRVESSVSVTSEGEVTVAEDGELALAAPEVILTDGFSAKAGSRVRIETSANGCL